MSDEEIRARAAHNAVAELGKDIAPLDRVQAMLVTIRAVRDAMKSLQETMPGEEREAILAAAARAALLIARKWGGDGDRRAMHAELVGGIQKLPDQQRLVVTMQWQDDMPDPEIAATLKISVSEVVALRAQALEELAGGARNDTE